MCLKMKGLSYLFLFSLVGAGCVHPIGISKRVSDIALTGVSTSEKSRIHSYSSELPPVSEYKMSAHTFQFPISESFGSQVSELFSTKYSKSSQVPEVIQVQLHSFEFQHKFVQSAAQALFAGGAEVNVSAKMQFSVTSAERTEKISVSNDDVIQIPPGSDGNAEIIRAFKSVVDRLLSLAIIKLNKHLDQV